MNNPELLLHDLCAQGFHIIDSLLPEQQCQALREKAEQMQTEGLFKKAKIGLKNSSQQNQNIRSDEIFWLENSEQYPEIKAFLSHIEQLATLLNQSLFLGLSEYEAHFAHYQPGAFYKKHIDQFTQQNTRKISFVYYLNKNWHPEYGGALKLYDQHDQFIQQVLPQENRFICFNSTLPHEVCTTLQPRYSITGWLKTRSLTVV